ncbi:malate synthase A [Haliangium sp.]|uniref:malate synthase A n=1 Tax=Haliangium sp. TaxID=2663208 RepID=UPI003D0D903D
MPKTKSSTTLELVGATTGRMAEILTPAALAFVEGLVREFNGKRVELLSRRATRQAAFDAGELPDFLAETRSIRESEWTVAPIRADLLDRRVEITGPVERKMIINALNSGANVFMADFEDSNAPTWDNVIDGQINLYDAVRRTIEYTSPEGKHYALGDTVATLMVRPRGWHLDEKHILLDGAPISASLVDFGLYFFHNAKELLERGSGPYFYLPKLESHLEARLWNDVFLAAQDMLGVPRGSIRATVLIETIPAAFEMEEILYELRQHSAGLNCGRWDYIFSIIKRFRNRPDFVMPDRAQVTMTTHAMHSYSLLAIKTCHRRGAHAIGGMAAQIPIKNDAAANEQALGKVRDDKRREAGDGHDGTWVAHPGLVAIAKAEFDAHMAGPHQIDKKRTDVQVTAKDLLTVPEGAITEKGLRHNLDVGIRYLGAWLAGTGCVPIYNLMEDAATAEISRAQVWQWIHHDHARLEDGRDITAELVRTWLGEELTRVRSDLGPSFENGRYQEAAELIEQIVTADEFNEFMTTVAYDRLA